MSPGCASLVSSSTSRTAEASCSSSASVAAASGARSGESSSSACSSPAAVAFFFFFFFFFFFDAAASPSPASWDAAGSVASPAAGADVAVSPGCAFLVSSHSSRTAEASCGSFEDQCVKGSSTALTPLAWLIAIEPSLPCRDRVPLS